MLHKRAWIDALHARGIDRIVDEAWVRSAINEIAKTDLTQTPRFRISTLAATARRVTAAGGDWSQLVPRFSGRGGAGKFRIDPRAGAIIDQQLSQLKQTGGRLVKQEVCASIRAAIESSNLACPENPIALPGNTTISRRIAREFTAYEICARNKGEKYARRQFRNHSHPRDTPEHPLLVSEYDDMDCEVFLVDDHNGLPVGRMSQSTLVPLGFDLSHKSRSFDSAMGAICDSLLPKDLSLPTYAECKHDWIGYGVQGSIILDNAKYNFSNPMRAQAEAHGLLLAGARPYGPTEKSVIEHFNHITKSDFCPRLPGWRGSKDDPDSVKTGLAAAIMTVGAFRCAYAKWVTDIYLNHPGVDGWTPRQRWLKYFKDHSPAIRWSRDQIALIRLRPEPLKLRPSGGILRLGLTYDSDELFLLRKQLGPTARVVVFTDTKDLSYVMVKNPITQQPIRAQCTTDYRYPQGITEHQQKWVLKICWERRIKNPSLKDMVQGREELRAFVAKEATAGKMRRRQVAERTGMPTRIILSDEEQTVAVPTKLVDRVMSDLEWRMLQLEEVTLELNDEDWGNA
jgi:putative transposase